MFNAGLLLIGFSISLLLLMGGAVLGDKLVTYIAKKEGYIK